MLTSHTFYAASASKCQLCLQNTQANLRPSHMLISDFFQQFVGVHLSAHVSMCVCDMPQALT